MQHRFLLITLLILGSWELAITQRSVDSESKFTSHFYFQTSHITGRSGHGATWSSYGGGYDLNRSLNDHWHIGLRTNFRSWSDRSTFLLPINLGPGYSIVVGDRSFADVFIGAGPALVVGNDYASVFAHISGGVRLNLINIGSQSIFTGVYFSQAMAFHPSPFEHLDIVLGIKL